MRRKRWISFVMVICLCVLCGTGCKDKENGQETNEETAGIGSTTVGFAQVGGNSTEESTQRQEPTEESPETEELMTEEPTEAPLVFEPVEETVYTTDRLNIRLAPSTNAEILRTMYLGESVVRTGIADGWSRILYEGEEYYVASDYLSLEPVIADTFSERVEQLLYGMDVAKETDQLVLAVGNNDGTDQCTVFYFTKDSKDQWTKHFEAKGFWGYGGVKEVIYEMDGCTPIGCFPFRFAYGIMDDPGSIMEYKQATETAYMVDDVNSKYYNQWVDTADEGVVKDWNSAEYVIACKPSYDYGLFIDNNPTCDPTQGSSIICIHCKTWKGTSPGCINIDTEHIIQLVTELDYDSRIVIVYGVEDLADY